MKRPLLNWMLCFVTFTFMWVGVTACTDDGEPTLDVPAIELPTLGKDDSLIATDPSACPGGILTRRATRQEGSMPTPRFRPARPWTLLLIGLAAVAG